MRTIRLLVFVTLTSFTIQAQNLQGRLTNLGPQISAAMIRGSIFIEDKDGKQLIYTVVRGNPAHLMAI